MNVEMVNMAQLPWVNRAIVYTILDLPTMLSYNIVGEFNRARHADYVCATREDTEIKRRTAGSRGFNENWAARSSILTIGDRHFVGSTHNAAHPPSAEGYTTLQNAGYTAAKVGHTGHFCFWVADSITGQPGQRLTAAQLAYQTDMRNGVAEAWRIAQNMTAGEEDMTQERFNEMMDVYLAGRGELPPRTGSTFEPFLAAKSAGITDGSRPQAFPTRQEMAVMVNRVNDKVSSLARAMNVKL